jgi:hypothetical protein
MPDRKHYADVTIELQGHKGYGASVEVEVEFTVSPIIPARGPSYASGGQPAEGGEVEITAIKPYVKEDRKRAYLDAPGWLADLLAECIDTDELLANAEPDEGPDPDDWYDRKRDEAMEQNR